MTDYPGSISPSLGLTDQANYGDGANLLPDPDDFTAWTASGATPPTVNAGADTGPFGDPADVVSFGASGSILTTNVTLLDGARYHMSVWARNNETFLIRLNLTNSNGSVVRYIPPDGRWYLIEADPPIGADDFMRIQKVNPGAAFDVSLWRADLRLSPRLYVRGWSDQAHPPRIWRDHTPGFSEDDAVDEVLAAEGTGGSFEVGEESDADAVDSPGFTQDELDASEEWFENIHVLPRRIDLGNIFSPVQFTVELFNADRFEEHELQAFTNSAGAGITALDLPSLPETLPILDGFTVTFEVSPDGPPIIDGTLDWDFDLYDVFLPITGTRLVIFPFSPEAPLGETLAFLTEVQEHRDASEMRIKLRKNPRQIFDFSMSLAEDDRRAFDSLMLDWQSRLFGVPVWYESTKLTQPALATETTLHVTSTRYADYRPGSLLVVLQNRKIFDALEIDSIQSGTILELASPLNNSYPVGTRVMPLRTAFAQDVLSGTRAAVNLGTTEVRFQVTDNDSNLASTAAFPTLLGKVLLSGPNWITGPAANNLIRKLQGSDSLTGVFVQGSPWDRSLRVTQKGFTVASRQALWQLRQLLHHLSGRQVAFYLPTFYDELVPSAQLSSGSPTLTIENVGYTRFVQDRKGLLRVILTNGTILTRTVSGSAEIDEDTEQLTLVETWPSTIQPSEVERIEYVELVRFDTDTIQINHLNDAGYATITAPVKELVGE